MLLLLPYADENVILRFVKNDIEKNFNEKYINSKGKTIKKN